MKTKNFTDSIHNVIMLACGGCVILVITLILNKDYPLVGHDYGYFIPRLIDTNLHIRLNGLSIQWYTPSFGGGLPAFPNPQHLEYSIVQWLSYFVNPWSAILLSTAVVLFAGYYFFYKLLNQKLELNWMASTLGAMFFIGNGFYIEHMIVGHLGFQLFPLGSLILYIIINTHDNKVFYSGITIALLITLIIYQAGFIISIITFLSFCITLPIIYLYKPQILQLKQITITCILAVILATAMTGSKLYAVSALMQHFPRNVSDFHNISPVQALMGVVVQLFGVMTFAPMLLIMGVDPSLLSGAFNSVTGTDHGIWELDISLSPVLLFFLFLALIRLITNIRKNRRVEFGRKQIQAMLILLFMIWIALELSLAKGAIYSFTKQLPILKSLHVNVRFTAAFILPLVIVGAFEADRLLIKEHKLPYFFISALLSISSLASYFFLSGDVHWRYVNLLSTNEIHRQIQGNNIFSINRITNQGDLEAFLEYASSYKPYEVLFGYYLENFVPQTHPGSVFEIENGYFNMTNPASLVFPKVNNLRPFERFKVSERDKLELFLERRQPEWNIPVAQKFLNGMSLITLIFTVGVLVITGAVRIKAAVRAREHSD